MSIWTILGIRSTDDKKKIKKAYHAKLRITNPEEDQEAFIQLRQAYEEAINRADQSEESFWIPSSFYQKEEEQSSQRTKVSNPSEFVSDSEEDWENEEEWEEEEWEEEDWEDEEEEWEDQEASVRRENPHSVTQWMIYYLLPVFQDIRKRWDSSCWKELLYNGMPFQLQYYDRCRDEVYDFLFNAGEDRKVFLPEEVWQVIDGFFSYSGTDIERILNRDQRLEKINQTVKQKGLFVFSKFDMEAKKDDIDLFCREYQCLIDILIQQKKIGKRTVKGQIGILEGIPVFYLPFECLKVAYRFQNCAEETNENSIRTLEERFGDVADIRLLQAEYCLYQKNIDEAVEILKQLYKEISVKDFVMVYQLAICCEKAGLYREAKQLMWVLTWLEPSPVLFEKIEFLSEQIQKEDEGQLWEEPSEELRKLVESEERARELFEQQKYEETVCACNEILERYPVAYPILLLRSHADFCNLGDNKRYDDLGILLSVNPNSVEVRKLIAAVKFKTDDLDTAIEVLEPVREQCYPQQEYLKLLCLKTQDYDAYYQGMFEIFQRSMTEEFPTEALSRHHLLDLSTMFEDMSDVINRYPSLSSRQQIFDFFDRLKTSKYNHPEEYMNLYVYYVLAHRYEEAIALCEERLRNSAGENRKDQGFWLHRHLFLAEYYAGYYQKAIEEIPYLLKSGPANVPWSNIAVVCEWAGRLEEAEEYLKKALEYKGSGRASAHFSYIDLTQFYVRRGQEEKAIETANKAIEICGKSGRLYIALFNFYDSIGRYDDAIQCVEQMKKYARGDEFLLRQYHFCLGNAYSGKAAYREALEHYKKAAQDNCPVGTDGNMGICYYALGEYEEAKKAFQRRIDNSQIILLVDLFLIQHCHFFLHGKPDEKTARKLEEECNRRMLEEPDNKKNFLAFLGDVAASRGEFQKAEEFFVQAEKEKICPGCWVCHELLWAKAWMYIYQGMYQEAEKCLKKAQELESEEDVMNADYAKVCRIIEEKQNRKEEN